MGEREARVLDEEEFWREMRRSFLLMASLIEQRFGFRPNKRGVELVESSAGTAIPVQYR